MARIKKIEQLYYLQTDIIHPLYQFVKGVAKSIKDWIKILKISQSQFLKLTDWFSVNDNMILQVENTPYYVAKNNKITENIGDARIFSDQKYVNDYIKAKYLEHQKTEIKEIVKFKIIRK